MQERTQKAFAKRLREVLGFVSGVKKVYKYVDPATKTEVTCENLSDLPCEFTLFMFDKDLVSKQKNSLRSELDDFLRKAEKSWPHYTGDHLHPVPNTATFDKESYNPTLGYYGMKRNKAFWLKKSGEVRVNYLEHLLAELENA